MVTVPITVNPVNDAPTATAQSVTTNEDTAKVVTLAGADVDGDSLGFKVTSLAANGKLYAGSGTGGHLIVAGDLPYTLAGNQVTYDPNLNYNGPDSFNFKAHDGTVDSAAATVSITVTPVNDKPTVSADNATVSVNEGQTASNTGTYGDVDGDTVTLSASVGTVVKNSGGTWSWSFLTGDGPDQSQTVTITANDGAGGTETTSFALTVVNVAPTASNGSFVFDPILGTATAGFDFSDVGFLDTHGPNLSFFTWSDVGNRFASVTEEHAAPNATGHASDTRTLLTGCYNLTVTGTAKDDDGGTSAALPIYSNSATSVHGRGFRPPIMDSERNIAKYGNVVPVKVTLTNTCTGASVTNVSLYITLAKGAATRLSRTRT